MKAPDIHDELHDAPLLRQLRGSAPIPAPDGFFEGFPQRMEEAVRREERRTIVRRLVPWAALAAAAALAVLWTLRTPSGIDASTHPPVADALEALAPDDQDAWEYWFFDRGLLADLALPDGASAIEPGAGFTVEELSAYLESSEHHLHLYTDVR